MRTQRRFRRALSLLAAMCIGGAACIDWANSARGLQLSVSPTGDDAHPNPDYATIAGARNFISQWKKDHQGKLPEAVEVVVKAGTYWLAEPLVMGPGDSGEEGKLVTYRAAPGEAVVLSRGARVADWKESTLDGKKVWMAALPADVKEAPIQFWMNGKRATRARFPNAGYLHVERVIGAGKEWNVGQKQFGFHEGDVPKVSAANGVDCVATCRWVENRLPVEKVDEKEKVVSFGKASTFTLEKDDPYFLEGARAFLDAPGEWWIDLEGRRIYCIPREGEKVEAAQGALALGDAVVKFAGSAEAGGMVHDIAFEGFTLSHTEWRLPKDAAGFSQAAIGVPAALQATGAQRCRFANLHITHVGGYGLELGGACAHNVVTRCTLEDLGAGGVMIGETADKVKVEEQTFDNEVSDCVIRDGGHVFMSGIGAWIGQSYGNRLSHNEIADFYYTGISVGWRWGYAASLCKANVVEFNHVHHIGKKEDGDGPIFSDMGGIYTLGPQEGTVIRSNYFHDIAALRYGGWGIYFDEGSTHITAEDNIVLRTTHGGFHQHYGKENVVRRNVFAYGRDAQIQRSRPEAHRSFTFEKNVVVWDRGALLAGDYSSLNLVFDNNIYFDGGAEPKFGKMTLAQWREKGLDVHSRFEDPGFVDAAKGDFRLKPDAPAATLGLRLPAGGDVGPRPVAME